MGWDLYFWTIYKKMKKLLGIVVLSLFLSANTYANDIRKFNIEGMRIGDSALDFFNETQLEDNEHGWYNYSYNEYSTSFMPGKGNYDWFLVSYKSDDDNFKIEALVGGINKTNYDNKKCDNNLDTFALNISKLFKNTKQKNKKVYQLQANASRKYPFTGKSIVTNISFHFPNEGEIILACYNIDQEVKQNASFIMSNLNQNDSFRISVKNNAFINYLKKE
jgi:hypothetical protein